ncbi:MAG: flagellar assembly peptidoglycan hydrolase FlgJ [Pseudomonadales bacterium]
MLPATDTSAGAYTDLNALHGIKTQGRESQDEGLKATAKQFESLFLHLMLKSMRDANKVFSEDNYFTGFESEFHQEMLDSQLSVSLTEGQGMGLADALYAQMQQQFGANKGDKILAAVKQAGYSVAPVPKDELADAAITVLEESGAITIDSPRDFIEKLLPYAEAAGRELGVEPKALLAQAALETGWGKHIVRKSNGEIAFNAFGIKADKGWQGERVQVATLEYNGTTASKQQAQFRSYNSFAESFADYAQFIKSNPRYQEALAAADNVNNYWKELQAAGYATDPAYAQKLASIYNSPHLAAADNPGP